MRVELLWWEGCPSYPETLAQLERTLAAAGLDSRVQMVEIKSEEQARSERFPGSPTIRVDGDDIFPCPDEGPYALTCRVYRLRDGRPSPTPDPEDLLEVIRRIDADRR
jgi:hypothetical protein